MFKELILREKYFVSKTYIWVQILVFCSYPYDMKEF